MATAAGIAHQNATRKQNTPGLRRGTHIGKYHIGSLGIMCLTSTGGMLVILTAALWGISIISPVIEVIFPITAILSVVCCCTGCCLRRQANAEYEALPQDHPDRLIYGGMAAINRPMQQQSGALNVSPRNCPQHSSEGSNEGYRPPSPGGNKETSPGGYKQTSPAGCKQNNPPSPGSYKPPSPGSYTRHFSEGYKRNNPPSTGGYKQTSPGGYKENNPPSPGCYKQTSPGDCKQNNPPSPGGYKPPSPGTYTRHFSGGYKENNPPSPGRYKQTSSEGYNQPRGNDNQPSYNIQTFDSNQPQSGLPYNLSPTQTFTPSAPPPADAKGDNIQTFDSNQPPPGMPYNLSPPQTLTPSAPPPPDAENPPPAYDTNGLSLIP